MKSRAPAEDHNVFIPALRFKWLTRFYDPLVSVTLREEQFKRDLIAQANIQPGHGVLDLGCGTGTLTLLIAERCPESSIVGLDADPEVLDRAKQKAIREHANVTWVNALSSAASFSPASFDRVLSSLFFHHLASEQKLETLVRVLDWLKPGGELHIADWGAARGLLMRTLFLSVQLLDGFETTRDSVEGKLLDLLHQAGFSQVEETRHRPTVYGTLSFYRAVKR